MSSLRVQGLLSDHAFDKAIQDLEAEVKVPRWKVAAQSEKYWEATLTFANATDLKKAVRYLQDLLSRERETFDGVVVDTTFNGITVLHCNDCAVDIIAVHGLGGHGAATWTYAANHAINLWLRDILPRDLGRSRIMTFGYDAATVSRSTANIRDIATLLLNGLQTMRRSDSERTRPIVFMAHSLGGIIVKWALKLAKSTGNYADIDRHTEALVFFGTPHHGSGTANWGKVIASVVNVVKTTNTNYLDTLKDRSQHLAELDDDFVPLLRDGNFKIFSVYETKKMPVKLRTIPISRSILIVPKESALLKSPNETPIPATADHRGVCKFESQNDSAYRTLCSKLSDLIPKSIPRNELVAKQVLTYPKNVPKDRYFHGRAAILEMMHDYLDVKESDTRRPRCLALYGEPAVGKTSLVKRFVQSANAKNQYDYILLVTAESVTKLTLDFVGLGRFLGLTKTISDDPVGVRDSVLDHLNSTNDRVLLVFDNADSLDELKNLRDFWPYESKCSVLVTSREASVVWRLPTKTEGLQIKRMTDEEGEQFLIDRLKVQGDENTRRISRSVAVRFNCWPLALGQVSAFILESKITLKKFWDILANKPETTNRIYEHKDKESSYEYTLSQVWDSILTKLAPNSARLLSVLSLLDPDGIPDHLFRGWNPDPSRIGDSGVLDEFEYFEARGPLSGYNIMEITEDVATLHRIVQSTQLKLVSEAERGVAFQSALLLLAASFPKQRFGNHMHDLWVNCEVVLPHLLSFDNAMSTFGWSINHSDASIYVGMMCDATWYLWEIGRYDEALFRVNNAEKVCQKSTGMQTLELARLHVVRGSVLSTLNRYKEAGAEFQKGLAIRQKLLDPDDQLLANSYMQVGNFLLSEDRFDESIDAQQKVIAIRQKSYEQTPAMMIISYFNLSRSLLGAKRLGDADEALAKGAECEKHLSSEAERTAYKSTRLYVSGNVALAQGNLTQALDLHREALKAKIEARSSAFGIAASRHKLGDIFARLQDLRSAKSNVLESIDILEKASGNFSNKAGRLARSEMKLSEICAESGDTQAADFYREKAFEHLQKGTSLSLEAIRATDFDKLVPHLDR